MKRETRESIQVLVEQALPRLWKEGIGDVFVLTKHTEELPKFISGLQRIQSEWVE